MIIEIIYRRLKERDRKLSKSEFCRQYLNTSRNYWFTIRNKKKNESNDVLINLYGNLKGMANTWREIGSDDSSLGVDHYKDMEKFSLDLADEVMGEIERRALS